MIEKKLKSKAKDRGDEYIHVVFLSDALEAHSKLISGAPDLLKASIKVLKLIEEEYMELDAWGRADVQNLELAINKCLDV